MGSLDSLCVPVLLDPHFEEYKVLETMPLGSGETLFYLASDSGVRDYTGIAVFNNERGAAIVIQHDPHYIYYRFLFEREAETFSRKILPGTRIFYKKDIKDHLEECRNFYRFFRDYIDDLSLFQRELERQGKNNIARLLVKDLLMIRMEFTDAAKALLNTNSKDPIHDFLMITDSTSKMHATKR